MTPRARVSQVYRSLRSIETKENIVMTKSSPGKFPPVNNARRDLLALAEPSAQPAPSLLCLWRLIYAWLG